MRDVTRLTLWAIDPGDVHVGLARFELIAEGWQCVQVAELTPDEFLLLYAQHMVSGGIDITVYERFILEAARAPMLAGTELETSQMIGALKWIHGQCATAGRWPSGDPILVGQTNKIKTPTRSLLKKRGIKSRARVDGVSGDHAKDAELHGYHYILRTLTEPIVTPALPRKAKSND